MVAKVLWLSGSAIFLLLGSLHLYYTFFTSKFEARNNTVTIEMKNTSPVLTDETSMWNAWIGFNASHSAGAIFIGLVNILLAAQYFPILQNSVSIIALNLATAIFYCWLAKKYWFRIPFKWILLATGCFATASIINYLG